MNRKQGRRHLRRSKGKDQAGIWRSNRESKVSPTPEPPTRSKATPSRPGATSRIPPQTSATRKRLQLGTTAHQQGESFRDKVTSAAETCQRLHQERPRQAGAQNRQIGPYESIHASGPAHLPRRLARLPHSAAPAPPNFAHTADTHGSPPCPVSANRSPPAPVTPKRLCRRPSLACNREAAAPPQPPAQSPPSPRYSRPASN